MIRAGLLGALCLCLSWPSMLWADAMLLIQGHLSHAQQWRHSGVAAALVQAGWQDGGHLHLSSQGVALHGPPREGEQQFYTITLDTAAPLWVQQQQLTPYLRFLAGRHAGEALHLVGHSAGGVVARLWLVQHRQPEVASLITLASPHLGTGLAELGRAVGSSPLAMMAPMLGAGEFNRSQALLVDLQREQSGNLLYWLNRQVHPGIRYVAMIRDGDALVPPWSQDMGNVAALRGRVERVALSGGHALQAGDGWWLARLLAATGTGEKVERGR